MSVPQIAFLTHEPFYPPSGGGSAEAVYLVEEMIRRGWPVHVFCPKIADVENIEKKFGIHLHPFSRWQMGRYAKFRNFKYLAYPFFLERLVVDAAREIKFDLIFSQHAISAVAAGKLKRRLKIPVVMNFPDLLTGFMETWPRYVAPRFMVEALKRYELSLPRRYDADGVLAVSNTLVDFFSETGFSREKIMAMYYGYDAGNFPLRSQPLVKKESPVIVMHGSFDSHHLGKIAFDAIRCVTKKRPGVIFRFIGKKTSTLEKLLARAQEEISGFRFEAIGFMPYTEVSKQLADAAVGIVPYEESAGTHCAFVAKVVEYVASGLPAICTPIKSIQNYFKDDGVVEFSEFDGDDFGRKIIARLDQPPSDWQLRAAQSAARVRRELDWNPLCRRAIDFVEAVLVRVGKDA